MNKMLPFFSVIVPTYNVEKYIDECIESVINQTYSSWELILIDDGSEDNTCLLCRKYAENDDRIVLLSQKHSMQATARNKGINVARGRYIVFLDADDYWENNHLKNLSRTVDGYDMSIANNHINFGINYEHMVKLFDGSGLASREEIIKRIFDLKNNLPGAMCLNCFNKEFLDKYDIRFNREYACSEDLDLFLQGIIYSKKIAVYTEKYYYYRQSNENSTTHTMNESKIMDRLNVYVKWCTFFDEHTELSYSNLAGRKLAHDMCYTIRDLYGLSVEKKDIKKFLRQNDWILKRYEAGSWIKHYYWEGYIQNLKRNYITCKGKVIRGIYMCLKKVGIK